LRWNKSRVEGGSAQRRCAAARGGDLKALVRRNKDAEGSLVDSVVDAIERMVARRELVPGQKLVEADIAARLSVSRNPVREAFRLLAGDGVLKLIHNRGVQVRSLTPKEVGDMLAVLGEVIKLAFKELAQQRTQQKVFSVLIGLAGKIEQAGLQNSADEFLELTSRFLQEVAVASNNQYIVEIVGRAHFTIYNRQVADSAPSDVILKSASCYRTITQCLIDGDWNTAQTIFGSTVDATIEILRKSE